MSEATRQDLDALREGLRLVEECRKTHEDRARMARVEANAEMERRQAGAYAAVAAVVRRELEAPAAGEHLRERVAREVFALDADWRREYWVEFRRDFPRQAQVYYDTADRILGLWRTPRGEGEAWCAFLDALDEFEAAAASLWADPAGPTAEDIERLDRARQRVIECVRALATIRPDAQGEASRLAPIVRAILERIDRYQTFHDRVGPADLTLPPVARTITEEEIFALRAALRSEAHGKDRWEDLVFGPIVEAYNETHDARRGEGGGK